jgi:hypothetical protein
VADLGEAGVDSAGAGVVLRDGRARRDGGWQPGAGQQDGFAVEDVPAAAKYGGGGRRQVQQGADVFWRVRLGDLDLVDGQVAAFGFAAPYRCARRLGGLAEAADALTDDGPEVAHVDPRSLAASARPQLTS